MEAALAWDGHGAWEAWVLRPRRELAYVELRDASWRFPGPEPPREGPGRVTGSVVLFNPGDPLDDVRVDLPERASELEAAAEAARALAELPDFASADARQREDPGRAGVRL